MFGSIESIPQALEAHMAYGCMDPLKGNWLLSGLRPDWKQVSLELTSGNGKVAGRAVFNNRSRDWDFEVEGVYNGAALELYFRPKYGEEEYGEVLFSFLGNCEGENRFDGFLTGELTGKAKVTYVKP